MTSASLDNLVNLICSNETTFTPQLLVRLLLVFLVIEGMLAIARVLASIRG